MSTDRNSSNRERISRRESMRRGLLGAGGVLLADRLGSAALAGKDASSEPAEVKAEVRAKVKAKSVIQIFLWGGMSHNDTWDPKPEAGRDYMGEFGDVVSTNVPGVQLGGLFPNLAQQADKYSLIRSMTRGMIMPKLLQPQQYQALHLALTFLKWFIQQFSGQPLKRAQPA